LNSTVWVLFDIHDDSAVGSIPVLRQLVVIILKLFCYFKTSGDCFQSNPGPCKYYVGAPQFVSYHSSVYMNKTERKWFYYICTDSTKYGVITNYVSDYIKLSVRIAHIICNHLYIPSVANRNTWYTFTVTIHIILWPSATNLFLKGFQFQMGIIC